MAETGTLWVCGAATKGMFVSCPIPKPVRSLSAAGRRAAVTLEDGNVLVLELDGKDEGKGPEADNGLVAVPWTRMGNDKMTAHTCLSSGSFGLVLSTEGEVFSWGDTNKWGELGLGGQHPQGTNVAGNSLVNSEVSKVAGSIYGKKIVKVAAGSTHAVVVSESGTLYSWGRGFEGQTGTTNLGVVLSPKLVKFSSETPIAAVSCGHNFTICVTKVGGQLYGFGEGGCGQLGIGKCVKFSDKAVKCSVMGIKRSNRKGGVLPPASSSGKSAGGGGGGFPAFVDVSCGWAHAIARNERGEVYVWGLNAHGQLGLGHTDSIHLPMLLKDPYADQTINDSKDGGAIVNETGTEYTLGSTTSEGARPPLFLKDISAYGLATAGVRNDGRVLTWGCARGGRLGHGLANQASVFEPKLVDFIAGQKISRVQMSADDIVAFAPTTLVRLEPTAGPIQGNSRFAITGSGLWSSDKIVVRFEPIPSDVLERMYPKVDFEPFTRARSTIGKFHYDPSTGLQSISCRTPNMADTQKSLKKYLASVQEAGLLDESESKSGGGGASGGGAGAAGSKSGGKNASGNSKSSSVSNSRSSLVASGDDINIMALLQPPHPQPMTISVSMNGIDFVPVGERGGVPTAATANGATAGFDASRTIVSRSMSQSMVQTSVRRNNVTELRSHGIGPEYKHRALYNFYNMSSFQLISVHPRLLTLPASTNMTNNKHLDPPVYLYIGAVGLYETNSIAVRLTAPGKKAIIVTTADVVYLRKDKDYDIGGGVASSTPNGGLMLDTGNALDKGGVQLGSSVDGTSFDAGAVAEMNEDMEMVEDGEIPNTGLYVRLKVNDAIRELDESGRLPFETSSIAVAMNGQDFVSLKGHRDENSVMFYRARLDSYTPSVVPAIAPLDAKDGDAASGVPVTVKGSGFFRVANRASCNGNTWHLRLRLTDPLPKSKEEQANTTAGSIDTGGDGGPGSTGALSRQKKKKLGPDVLVPCRYEDVNTLTALLPPFPLRSTYLTASNKRKKPKGGVEKWPKPWPSISRFQVDVVMASDDAKLLKLWENKLANGVEAPLAITSSVNGNNGAAGNAYGNEQSASTNEENALANADHLKVYSLPGMAPVNQGMPSFTLNVGSGACGPGKLVEITMLDSKFTLFDTKACLVRFAFTNKEGTKFIRDSGKKVTKPGPSAVMVAQAALSAAQASLDAQDDEEGDVDTEASRQEKLDKIAKCEEELAIAVDNEANAAEQEANDNTANSGGGGASKKCDWYVDVPAIVEEVAYIPETARIPVVNKKNKKNTNSSAATNNQTPKTRWVIRCRAPGLKKKNTTGGVEFDTSQLASLAQMNNNIAQALSANQNASRRRKSYKESDAMDLAKKIAHSATFGEPVPAATASQFGKTYARVFVALNGVHFHDWPSNALTNGEPPGPFEDKKEVAASIDGESNNANAAPVAVEKPPLTTVFNYIPEVATVTNVETTRGVRAGKEMVFNGKNLDVIVGVSKVKFIKLIPIPESDLLNHGSDDEAEGGGGGESASQKSSANHSTSTSNTNMTAKKRKQLILNSYQDGPFAVVPCLLRKGLVCCDIPWMGDEPTPMKVELYLDGLRVCEVLDDITSIKYQVPYPSKPTYSTIDIEYAGSVEDPPPEPPDEDETAAAKIV